MSRFEGGLQGLKANPSAGADDQNCRHARQLLSDPPLIVMCHVRSRQPHRKMPYAPSPETAAVAQTKPLNSIQKALVGLAANLPQAPGSNLQDHLAKLKERGPQPPPPD
jgi:hypothetical protein